MWKRSAHLDEERATDDALNGLILSVGLTWREVEALRTVRNHLLQIRPHYNVETVNRVLLNNSSVSSALFRYFAARFDPDSCRRQVGSNQGGRKGGPGGIGIGDKPCGGRESCGPCTTSIQCSLRTNFYQIPERPVFSIKVDSRKVEGMPSPQADVRDLRAFEPPRGHPPARGTRRARRHPLERPARRFQDRGSGIDADPDAEKHHHRARRIQGGICPQGQGAGASRTGRLPRRSIQRIHFRDCSTSRTTSWMERSSIRPRWCGMTRMILTWLWRRTRAPHISPILRTTSPTVWLLAGGCFCFRRHDRLRPQERSASPPEEPGNA